MAEINNVDGSAAPQGRWLGDTSPAPPSNGNGNIIPAGDAPPQFAHLSLPIQRTRITARCRGKRLPLDVLFRRIDEPVPVYWTPGIHWQVEAHVFGTEFPFPAGLCWVSDSSPLRPADWSGPEFPPVLDFILVADHFRRRGVARALVRTCRRRWPGLWLTDAVSTSGAAFLATLASRRDDDGAA
jgi:GNAT superfamily N-acetyltransferase